MPGPGDIKISEFQYELPLHRIAKYPLAERDSSKLLLLNNKGILSENTFSDLPGMLPSGSLLLLNNTKVVRARLFFRKPTGARIEIFCLEPSGEFSDVQQAFSTTSCVEWKCLVGNAKKWKDGMLSMEIGAEGEKFILYAEKAGRDEETFLVKFSWEPEQLSFSEVLQKAGDIPLPPYLNRKSEKQDKTTYQTVYARHDGSVAAPTAGLHFTPSVFHALEKHDIDIEYLTLHVSAGTFRPVSTEIIKDHHMHEEEIVVTAELVERLLKHEGGFTTAVGTTTVRTLESIYLLGLKVLRGERVLPYFSIGQWEFYNLNNLYPVSPKESLEALMNYMQKHNRQVLYGDTSMIIVPGYKFRFVDALVTNFHMPGSTLLLLVAALIGDKWKDAYNFALQHDFRLLSYGDSCLFFRQ